MNNQFDELTKSVAQSVMRRAALKKLAVGVLCLALVCFGRPSPATAAATFITLNYPGAVLAAADDINAHGQISGWYIDTSGIFHGFLLDNRNYTSITFPGAGHTSALGLNANGDVVGAYNVKQVGADKDVRGYPFRNGVFTEIDFPG